MNAIKNLELVFQRFNADLVGESMFPDRDEFDGVETLKITTSGDHLEKDSSLEESFRVYFPNAKIIENHHPSVLLT